MQRVIITSYHEIPDEVGTELIEAIRRDGHQLDHILRFMRENPPESLGYQIGGMKPNGEAPPEPLALLAYPEEVHPRAAA